MIANILIAIGFFFAGVLAGIILTVKEFTKAKKEIKNKHYIVYEF